MFVEVNGAPAVALADGGTLRGVLVLHTDGEQPDRPRLGGEPGRSSRFAERQLSRIGGLPGLSG